MELSVIIADPAGNTTAFVTSPVEASRYSAVACELMSHEGLHIEQVGFISGPLTFEGARMDMMGGEFCGNATRSFALLLAIEQGISSSRFVRVNVSGASEPVSVYISPETSASYFELPGNYTFENFLYSDTAHPVVRLEGIDHIIVSNIAPDADYANSLIEKARQHYDSPAIGVLFYDKPSCYFTPVIYVKDTDSTVFENSCASGTAAIGLYNHRLSDIPSWEDGYNQPGGKLYVKGDQRNDGSYGVTVGGLVSFQSNPL